MPFNFSFHPYHIASIIVIIVLSLGLRFRQNKRVHIGLMSTAFVMDMALLLFIEFNRHAVEKVAQLGLPVITWIHVAISIAVVVLYIAQIILGIKLNRAINQKMPIEKQLTIRQTHKKTGILFYTLRLLNFGTSLILPL